MTLGVHRRIGLFHNKDIDSDWRVVSFLHLICALFSAGFIAPAPGETRTMGRTSNAATNQKLEGVDFGRDPTKAKISFQLVPDLVSLL